MNSLTYRGIERQSTVDELERKLIALRKYLPMTDADGDCIRSMMTSAYLHGVLDHVDMEIERLWNLK